MCGENPQLLNQQYGEGGLSVGFPFLLGFTCTNVPFPSSRFPLHFHFVSLAPLLLPSIRHCDSFDEVEGMSSHTSSVRVGRFLLNLVVILDFQWKRCLTQQSNCQGAKSRLFRLGKICPPFFTKRGKEVQTRPTMAVSTIGYPFQTSCVSFDHLNYTAY